MPPTPTRRRKVVRRRPRRPATPAPSSGESAFTKSATPLGKFSSTAYGPPWGGINGPGEATACGVAINGGSPIAHGVAAGPGLECGTILQIDPNPFGKGYFVVWDRGDAIGDRNIDFYDWRGRASQMAWGTKEVNVTRVGKISLPSRAEDVDKAIVAAAGGFDKGPAGEFAEDVTGTIGSVGDAMRAIVAFIARLFEPSFWLRVGKAIIGVVALIIGTGILAKAMLGVDLGIGERTARGAGRARARRTPHESMDPPSKAAQSRGARRIERAKEDDPSLGYQKPLEDPPF